MAQVKGEPYWGGSPVGHYNAALTREISSTLIFVEEDFNSYNYSGRFTYTLDADGDIVSLSGTITGFSYYGWNSDFFYEDYSVSGIAVSAANASRATLATMLAGDDVVVGYDSFEDDDRLFGYGGNDTLRGLRGNDNLDGGKGADVMDGGRNNDTFYVDNARDVVIETVDPDEGPFNLDVVIASVSYRLGLDANVERMEAAAGTAAITLGGNDLDQELVGNAGDNLLLGLGGADTLTGGLGNDRLAGGLGDDRFVFGTALNPRTNVDTLTDFRNRAGNDDAIELDNAVFAALRAPGALNAAYFEANATGRADDRNDFIVYETDTGKLFYDADGNGAGRAAHFATVASKIPLTAGDFLVI